MDAEGGRTCLYAFDSPAQLLVLFRLGVAVRFAAAVALFALVVPTATAAHDPVVRLEWPPDDVASLPPPQFLRWVSERLNVTLDVLGVESRSDPQVRELPHGGIHVSWEEPLHQGVSLPATKLWPNVQTTPTSVAEGEVAPAAPREPRYVTQRIDGYVGSPIYDVPMDRRPGALEITPLHGVRLLLPTGVIGDEGEPGAVLAGVGRALEVGNMDAALDGEKAATPAGIHVQVVPGRGPVVSLCPACTWFFHAADPANGTPTTSVQSTADGDVVVILIDGLVDWEHTPTIGVEEADRIARAYADAKGLSVDAFERRGPSVDGETGRLRWQVDMEDQQFGEQRSEIVLWQDYHNGTFTVYSEHFDREVPSPYGSPAMAAWLMFILAMLVTRRFVRS